ncbi:LD-carboxypeptidase [Rapidithrix thailandica]|uniref:LD-carboxypeptidase n=1 Tax=Rapidithrix thailandica TaxID=413964 RepID=A0AAW9SD10_9BACT
MKNLIQPQALKKGDKIAVIAPAGKVDKTRVEKALSVFSDWDLNVVTGKYLYEENHSFAGSDAQRLEDFQNMLNNSQIRAIVCARGGYGITRILDQVDFTQFVKKPKWIVGYSDITALHGTLQQLGIQSIHGPMPIGFDPKNAADSLESLRKILFGEKYSIEADSSTYNRYGVSKGQVIGGNLSLLLNVMSTRSEPDYKDKILFIEDIDEYLYQIDRLMVQLKRSGKLAGLAGLVVGHFSAIKANESNPFGHSYQDIILEHTKEYSYPIAFNIPIGHEPDNLAVPCGARATLLVDEEETRINFDKTNSKAV